MKPIRTLDDLMDAIMSISAEKLNWNTSQFMTTLRERILNALKSDQSVSGDVFTAWFHIYALLGTSCTRDKIRGVALGVKDWLSHN